MTAIRTDHPLAVIDAAAAPPAPLAASPTASPTAPPSGPGSPVALDGVRALLAGLDRRQRQAVTHGEGPLLVVAGPGTGKTEVITRRIAWLIATKRARPSEILALTFTERAAAEMQARVDLLVPYGQADTAIHTFHAFGDRLVRDHGLELGLPGTPRVIGRSEQVMLLREHLFTLGLRRYLPLADPTRFLEALAELFARAKEEGAWPAGYAAFVSELRAGAEAVLASAGDDGARAVARGLLDEAEAQAELAAAYLRYQELLLARGLIDHGDQVALAARLLRERPAVREELRRRFRHVLVDEFQDSDAVQMDLLAELTAPGGNVTFVGDDDQAIYTFRGAAVENMLGLRSTFPALRQVVLRRNYRSRAPILEAARRLIRHNDPARLESRESLDKTLTATRRTRRPAPVRHIAYAATEEEAEGVADGVQVRLARGLPPDALAVLVRTNADARPVLSSLQRRGIPVRTSGGGGLFSHPEVRELLALLRVLDAPERSLDLYAVATAQPYRLGGEELTAIMETCGRRHLPLWAMLRELEAQPGLCRLRPETQATIGRMLGDLRTAIAETHERAAPEVLYGHLRRSGRLSSLVAAADGGDELPLRRVARFFEALRDHASLVEDQRLASVLPAFSALADLGDDRSAAGEGMEEPAVAVLTVHQAKGLEFAVVFLVGLAEGRFPIRQRQGRLPLPAPLARGGDLAPAGADPWAEERRLFYVAMTRARDELILSHASVGREGGRPRRPSPFIAQALDHAAEAPARSPLASLAADVPAIGGGGRPPAAPAAPGALAGPLSLSFTQLDDYLSCPLRYRLRHELRVPAPPHHALVLGNALHQAVGAFHLAEVRGRPLTVAQVQEVFALHWSAEGFLSREHEEARYAAGRDALARFVAARGSAVGRAIVGVERPFSARFGRDTVRGRYDLVTQSPEGPVITDYKSSDVRDAARVQERARSSLQLQVYALAHEAETGTLPAAVELHFLESGLVGRVTPDRARLEKARAAIAAVAEGIRARRLDATPGYLACEYCPYRQICPSAA